MPVDNFFSLLAAAGGGNNQDLASLFECPVCFDYALPPIMQCQSGHIVCQSCRQKLNLCPTCRGPLGKTYVMLLFQLIKSKNFGLLLQNKIDRFVLMW